MNKQERDAYNLLRGYKQNLIAANYTNVNAFRNRINKLINSTPTGDLRNEYTDLNILFERIMIDQDELQKLGI